MKKYEFKYSTNNLSEGFFISKILKEEGKDIKRNEDFAEISHKEREEINIIIKFDVKGIQIAKIMELKIKEGDDLPMFFFFNNKFHFKSPLNINFD